MWKDPIVEETRKLRESYAADLGNDLDAIYQDVVRRQTASTRKKASLPPRKASNRSSPA